MLLYVNLRMAKSVMSPVTQKPGRVYQAYEDPSDGLATFVNYDSYKKIVNAAKSGDQKLVDKVLRDLNEQ